MSTTFTLATPATVGDLSNPRTVTALKITSIWFTSTPDLAPTGTGELDITLTETSNGWQETIAYKDASVISFFAQAAPAPPSGGTVEDVMCGLLFDKLIADGKLPAGTLTTVATPTTEAETTTSISSDAATPVVGPPVPTAAADTTTATPAT